MTKKMKNNDIVWK